MLTSCPPKPVQLRHTRILLGSCSTFQLRTFEHTFKIFSDWCLKWNLQNLTHVRFFFVTRSILVHVFSLSVQLTLASGGPIQSWHVTESFVVIAGVVFCGVSGWLLQARLVQCGHHFSWAARPQHLSVAPLSRASCRRHHISKQRYKWDYEKLEFYQALLW